MKRTNYLRPKYLFRAILGYISYFTFFPVFLPSLLNKLRGVKIKNFMKVNIAPFVTIDSIYPDLIEIEDGAMITRGCYIMAHFNPTNGISEIMQVDSFRKKILIKEDAFIGMNSVILPGVTIGRCAIIQPGSVVGTDVPDFTIFKGNPAGQCGRLPRTAVENYLKKKNP